VDMPQKARRSHRTMVTVPTEAHACGNTSRARPAAHGRIESRCAVARLR